ncbi:glycosyltransferase family 2 protein [Cohnella lupini]|uniref:Glycosyl transferase family 2 n=1 Tax=Cohnella lupini TaxID=1294267 RepID=A0A3D9I768_9BACL|nr:glycosyltransferase family 2 protein [Cohnella lupini]RED57597.1 glycosyl transferase family 2 [Cohnella lupini]
MTKLISVCMIVKNEEAVLNRCLQSISALVDEIIVVDTGSSDATKAIALKFTNHVYDFVWINDFSAARNEALKYATGRFILTLDADEYMDEANLSLLRDSLSKVEPRTDTLYQLKVVNYKGRNQPTTEEPIFRVFANYSNISYVRPIHEQPKTHSSPTTKVVPLPVKIYHSGYTEDVIKSKNKHERNMNIFSEMQKHSQLGPYDHCMIGRQLIMMDLHEEALEHLQKALKLGNKKEVWYKHNLISMLEVYLSTNKAIDAFIFMEKHFTQYLHYPDIRGLYAMVLERLGFWSLAKKEYEEAYKIAENQIKTKKEDVFVSGDLSFRIPTWNLAIMNENEQNYNPTIDYLAKLLIANKSDLESIGKFIEIASLNEKPEIIIQILEKLIQADSEITSNAIVGKLSISLNKLELARHYCDDKLLSGLYNPSEQLRYALIISNVTLFQSVLNKLTSELILQDPMVKRLIALGILIWEVKEWSSLIESDVLLSRFTSQLLNEDVPEHSDEAEEMACMIISELYSLQQWDPYETTLSHYETPKVINYLANFFLASHQSKTALQYYQHLLDHDAMYANSYANLAFYKYSQKETSEALVLWEKAINLDPSRKKLYIQYYEACQDPIKKQMMKKRLLDIEPQYSAIRLLK